MRDLSSTITLKNPDANSSHYGVPTQLVDDKCLQFTSFMLQYSIRHNRKAPYHPSSTGHTEWFVQTFKQAPKAGRTSKVAKSNFLI